MLMQTMRRSLIVFVLLVAAAIALEPVVHTHPLTQNASATQCALCVNAHAGVTVLQPAVSSPLVVVGRVAAMHPIAEAVPAPVQLASRAPPAA